jgi:hypothetical protein
VGKAQGVDVIRPDLWLKYVEERMENVTQVEKRFVSSAADVLVIGAPPERQCEPSYETDCIGALVAMVELVRSVVKVDKDDFRAVKT